MSRHLDWHDDGADWPHRYRSRFVEAADLRWHVQSWGDLDGPDPTLVLLHGSGASSHSWFALAPLLHEEGWSLLSMDLPGHAFTRVLEGTELRLVLTLHGMAGAVRGLLDVLGVAPAGFVGHSAGAAVALEVARDGGPARGGGVVPVAGLCPALMAGRGLPEGPVPELVGGAFRSRFVAHLTSGLVRHTRGLDSVLDGTGSSVPEESRQCYRILSANSDHVNATLSLFTRWDPQAVQDGLSGHDGPVLLVTGSEDAWIAPSEVAQAAERLPRSLLVELPGLGHLAHEEAAETVARHVLAFLENEALDD